MNCVKCGVDLRGLKQYWVTTKAYKLLVQNTPLFSNTLFDAIHCEHCYHKYIKKTPKRQSDSFVPKVYKGEETKE